MELKDKKFIKNTGKFPGFEQGKLYKEVPYGGIIGIDTGLPGSIIPNEGYVGNLGQLLNLLKYNEYLRLHEENQRYLWLKRDENIAAKLKTINTNNGDSGVLDIGGKVGAIGEFIGTAVNAFNPGVTSNELLDNATILNRSIGGVGYTTKNIHANDARDELISRKNNNWLNTIIAGTKAGMSFEKGGSMGKFKSGKLPKYINGLATGIGAMVGALVGGIGSDIAENKGQKEIAFAEMMANRQNMFNKNGAFDIVTKNDVAKQYGDTRSLYLRYCKGKMPKYEDGKRVLSSDGLVNMPQNAWVDGGEIIEDTLTGEMHRVPYSKHRDSFPAFIKGRDRIYTREESKRMTGYKNGKLPGFLPGKAGWANTAAAISGVGGGLLQYLDAASQKPKSINSYIPNPYGLHAADLLRGMRVSDYPILPELYNQYGRTMYAISNSGGLSGGLRTLARLSAMNNLQNNYAKLLQSNLLQNNQYVANYADYISKLGASEAANKAAALRYDLDYYSKAHAARQKGMQTGLYNMSNAMQRWAANNFKLNQFNDTLALYRAELAENQADRQMRAQQFQDQMKYNREVLKSYDTIPPLNYEQWVLLGNKNGWNNKRVEA